MKRRKKSETAMTRGRRRREKEKDLSQGQKPDNRNKLHDVCVASVVTFLSKVIVGREHTTIYYTGYLKVNQQFNQNIFYVDSDEIYESLCVEPTY